MLQTLLILLAVAPLWTKPAGKYCVLAANHKGDRALMACKAEDRWRLSLVDAGGSVEPFRSAGEEALKGVVSIDAIQWSPDDRAAAIEIGFDEEPGVVLVRVAETPSAVLIDRTLASMDISAAQPQWAAAGHYLLFRTSGTGERSREGLYALRMSDGALLRLLSAAVQSFALAGKNVLVTTRQELAAYRCDELLRHGRSVATVKL